MKYSDVLPPIRETKNYRGLFQKYRDICILEGIELSESLRCLMKEAIDQYNET